MKYFSFLFMALFLAGSMMLTGCGDSGDGGGEDADGDGKVDSWTPPGDAKAVSNMEIAVEKVCNAKEMNDISAIKIEGQPVGMIADHGTDNMTEEEKARFLELKEQYQCCLDAVIKHTDCEYWKGGEAGAETEGETEGEDS